MSEQSESHKRNERLYIAATTLARLRMAHALVRDCVWVEAVFPMSEHDLPIDIRGADGHLSVATSELEQIVERLVAGSEKEGE